MTHLIVNIVFLGSLAMLGLSLGFIKVFVNLYAKKR